MALYSEESGHLASLKTDLKYYIQSRVLQVRQGIRDNMIYLMVLQQDICDMQSNQLTTQSEQQIFKYDLEKARQKKKSILQFTMTINESTRIYRP